MESTHVQLPYHSEHPDFYCRTQASIDSVGRLYASGGHAPLEASVAEVCAVIQTPVDAVILETGQTYHGREGDYMVVGARPEHGDPTQRIYFFMKVERA